MSPISRGFTGRRREVADPSRVPPGQYVTDDFPVLSAGPTPHTPLEEWSFAIDGAVEHPLSWTWDEFLALPAENVTVDIHCVTKWSKLDTGWKGVSVDALLEGRTWFSDRYSVLDPYGFTFYTWGVRRELPMGELKNYTAFKDRMLDRPAVRRVVEDEKVKV